METLNTLMTKAVGSFSGLKEALGASKHDIALRAKNNERLRSRLEDMKNSI